MKKNLILSGNHATGKTTIANAIKVLFDFSKILEISGFKKSKTRKTNEPPFSTDQFDLVILEGCFIEDIIALESFVNNASVSVIYITQDKITNQFSDRLSVVNCNNNQF